MRVVGGVPGLLATGDEVDARYGDAVDGGPFACDGPPDGRGEVVIELRGCEGTGSFDEEDAGITVEADGVGVAQVGLIVAPTDLKFERVFHGSPYFFYQSFFFVFIRCVLGTSGSVLDTRGSVLGTMGGVLGSTAPEAVDALLISVLVHAAAGEQLRVDLLETGRALCELVRRENRGLSQDVEAIAGLAAGVLDYTTSGTVCQDRIHNVPQTSRQRWCPPALMSAWGRGGCFETSEVWDGPVPRSLVMTTGQM